MRFPLCGYKGKTRDLCLSCLLSCLRLEIPTRGYLKFTELPYIELFQQLLKFCLGFLVCSSLAPAPLTPSLSYWSFDHRSLPVSTDPCLLSLDQAMSYQFQTTLAYWDGVFIKPQSIKLLHLGILPGTWDPRRRAPDLCDSCVAIRTQMVGRRHIGQADRFPM